MIREQIRKIIQKSLRVLQKNKAISSASLTEVKVDYPENEKFGDYSTNIAFLLSKKEGRSPREVADLIASEITRNKKSKVMFEKVDVASSGFINFTISRQFLQRQLGDNLENGTSHINVGDGEWLNIEFLSANPTGKFQVGNGRGGFYGDVLGNIFKLANYCVKKEYYINNGKTSNQIQELGKTALGVGDKYLTDYLKIKIGEVKDKLVSAKQDKEGTSESKLYGEAGYIVAKAIHEDNKKFLEEKAGIYYDVWTEEETMHKKGLLEEALKILEKKGLVYENEGAKWLKTTQFGDDKDKVIVRSNGDYGYYLADIAYHLDKIYRCFDVIIDVFGADHQGHVEPMKIAIKILDYKGKFDILVTQLVQAKGGGRFSKRRGNVILLEELIREVGADAARFFYLMKSIDTQMEFDLDLAKEQSEKNPVYYVQYAYARMHGILANSKVPPSLLRSYGRASKNQKFSLLIHTSELKLLKYLMRWPEMVEDTARDYQVQRITSYATGLATVFNQFYRDCKVISDDKSLTEARLGLVIAAKNVLKEVLDTLGISAPEHM